MILEPEDATALIAQLEKEYQVIEDNWELNRQAWERIQNGAKHVLDWSASFALSGMCSELCMTIALTLNGCSCCREKRHDSRKRLRRRTG